MGLPNGERHRQNNWILEEKRKIFGKGLSGQDVVTNYARFKCSKCEETYTRFVYDDNEFKDLEVGFSNWIWGWNRVK